MVVGGTRDAVLMVESEAKELNEDLMLGAVLFAHQNMQVVIENCLKLKELVGNADWEIEEELDVPKFYDELKDKFSDDIKSAFSIANF